MKTKKNKTDNKIQLLKFGIGLVAGIAIYLIQELYF